MKEDFLRDGQSTRVSLRCDVGRITGLRSSGRSPEASGSPQSVPTGQEETLHLSGGQSRAGCGAAGCRAPQRVTELEETAAESPVRPETPERNITTMFLVGSVLLLS